MERQDSIIYNDPASSLTRQRRKRKITLALVVLAFVAILASLLYYYFSRKVKEYEEVIKDETQQIEVKIQGGVIRGILEGNVVVFKGIPYAIPPVDNQRWTPPVACGEHENKCWNGSLNASEFGSMCAQQDVLHSRDPSKVIGSEDCLFINVWTLKKRPSEKPLPVLVYIHGGFLMYSSGDWNGLHPSPEMVSEMKVVSVSFNYRLNAFGFLALHSLADASASKTSGNYGFMDQILALKWVQANIRKFGGDPKSVTLIGQSSGGTSELALLASPGAAGLFHRAIIMSASAVYNKSWEDAANDNKIFVNNSKCARNSSMAERECLYKLSPSQIEAAIPWDVYPYWRMADQNDLPTKNLFDGAVAVVDKLVVPKPPLVAMTTGEANDVPLIIGTTAQETNLRPVKNFANSTWEDYSAYVREKLLPFIGGDVNKVLSMYNRTQLADVSSASLQFAYSSMATDVRVTCSNDVLALNASRGFKNPVYRYVVTNSPSKPINLIGFQATFAIHMWDLVALFGFPTAFDYAPSSKDLSFMRDLRREFTKFIHGELNTSWKEYPENTVLFTDNGVIFGLIMDFSHMDG
ncbi:hypothetical protein OS493_022258 [Desmophyllum pertusum]|uniref:Carboxylic ester hydrolase n=1 Tax=Desmophyllum pertusum TaxID=174260 RepID=A0A9W9YCK3_9CNID|nr:hypothetical protein OS493_022258 [Desmophyllum pertusum]